MFFSHKIDVTALFISFIQLSLSLPTSLFSTHLVYFLTPQTLSNNYITLVDYIIDQDESETKGLYRVKLTIFKLINIIKFDFLRLELENSIKS